MNYLSINKAFLFSVFFCFALSSSWAQCLDTDACNYGEDETCLYNIGGGFFAPDAINEMGIGSFDWEITISEYDAATGMGAGVFYFIDSENESPVNFWITEEAFVMELNGEEYVFPIIATGVTLIPGVPPVNQFAGVEQCPVSGCEDELACNYQNVEGEPCSYLDTELLAAGDTVWLNVLANPNQATCDIFRAYELIESPSGGLTLDMPEEDEALYLLVVALIFPGILADMEFYICGETMTDHHLLSPGFDYELIDGAYFDLDLLFEGLKMYISDAALPPSTGTCLDPVACDFDPVGCGVFDTDNCTYPDAVTGLCEGQEEVLGCNDAIACNYNPAANQSDGSCIYYTTDNVSLEETFYHTPFLNAPMYTFGTGSCPTITGDVNDAVPMTISGDGIGAPLAWNYSQELVDLMNNGTGMSWASFFGASGEDVATEMTNSPFSLCENSISIQVDPNGVFSAVLGFVGQQLQNDISTGTWMGDHYLTDGGAFIPESFAEEGCADATACNYNACAVPINQELCAFPIAENEGCETCDDESVDLLITYDGLDGHPEEFSFEVENGAGELILNGGGAGSFEACVASDECITVRLFDAYGDGGLGTPSCGTVTIFMDGAEVASASCDWGYVTSFTLGYCTGCMDPLACNYDDGATAPGMCLYEDECGVCGGPGLPFVFTLDAVLNMDEDEIGDFSSDASNPTHVPFVGVGAYVLSGSAANFQTPNADPEYFSITIPAGYQIAGIRMLEFDQVGYEAAGEPAGNGGFFGIGATDALPIIYGPSDFPAAANALDGGWLVGVLPGTTEGYGILDDLMQPFIFPDFGINIPGLSGAPGEGTYTFMWKEGNTHPDAYNAYINWSFALEVTAVGSDHYTMLVDCDGCLNDSDDDGVCDELEIAGCTDAASCNYDPAATDDDDSCDDMPAAAAYCTEGTVWSDELCGCAPPSCLTDLDFNGETGTTDLLIMLSAFGMSCE